MSEGANKTRRCGRFSTWGVADGSTPPAPSCFRHRHVHAPLAFDLLSLKQNIPLWKLESLGRNMAAVFAGAGDDASLLCSDPASCYFLVSGSLTPVAVSASPAVVESLLTTARPLHENSSSGSPHPAPDEEHVSTRTESEARKQQQQQQHSARCNLHSHGAPLAEENRGHIEGSGRPSGHASSSWTDSPYDNNSSCTIGCPVWNNLAQQDEKDAAGLMDSGSEIESTTVVSKKNIFSVRTTKTVSSPKASGSLSASNASNSNTNNSKPTTNGANKIAAPHARGLNLMDGRPVLPGHSLDSYVLHNMSSSLSGGVGKVGRENDHDEPEHPGAIPAASGGLLGGGTTGPRRWWLGAREVACIGRVSRRFLQELEREGPKHEIEVKVAFLRKTEVSRVGEITRRRGARQS